MSITTINTNKPDGNQVGIAQFRLWQLLSPALPIGSYAYSQGLEYAVEAGWVSNEAEMIAWVSGIITHMHRQLDIPVLARLYHAWQSMNEEQIIQWNNFLIASRETSELTQEDCQLGRALTVLLKDLGCKIPASLNQPELTFATALAAAGVQWDIALAELAKAYVWIWLESQVAASIKLIPLGQTAGQRILFKVVHLIDNVIEDALSIEDEDVGQSSMGLSIASARHETQYTRIFRS
jgi:urease accessory protein